MNDWVLPKTPTVLPFTSRAKEWFNPAAPDGYLNPRIFKPSEENSFVSPLVPASILDCLWWCQQPLYSEFVSALRLFSSGSDLGLINSCLCKQQRFFLIASNNRGWLWGHMWKWGRWRCSRTGSTLSPTQLSGVKCSSPGPSLRCRLIAL